MKIRFLILMSLLCIVGFSACKEDSIISDDTKLMSPQEEYALAGTKWKLVSFVDAEADTLLKKVEPEDCEKCYILEFDTDSTIIGRTCLNDAIGNYHCNYSALTIEIINFAPISYAAEVFDSKLYVNSMNKVQSFYRSNKELKLFYNDNDNKNYLLFNIEE